MSAICIKFQITRLTLGKMGLVSDVKKIYIIFFVKLLNKLQTKLTLQNLGETVQDD
jgi:hypothetical protein